MDAGRKCRLVALLTASEPVFQALKLAGAAYLVYLGAQSLCAALARRDARATPCAPPRHALVSARAAPGCAQQPRQPEDGRVLREPACPSSRPSGAASFAVLLALGLLFCAMTLAWLTLYAVVVARARSFLAGPVRRALDAITGVVLVAFGLRLATDGA